MLTRRARERVLRALERQPAVALLGPRQCGKTTLARAIADEADSVYLDLTDPLDVARLADPRSFLTRHEGRLVVLDEIHRTPELFLALRSLIDDGRRRGLVRGRFLILGSASMRLLRQSAETLTGRIAPVPLSPFDPLEVEHLGSADGASTLDRLWLRGGFPTSFLASDDQESFEIRQDMVATILGRDIPEFAARPLPMETLRRFLTMLAHQQGGPVNRAALASGLGMRESTVARYLDLFVDLLLVRRVESWTSNAGKRLRKAPRILIRDSGLVHALLHIRTLDELLGHPVAGLSWEAFVVENVLRAAPPFTSSGAYRSLRGAECDLVLELPGNRPWAIEVKRGRPPKLERGFWDACDDIRPSRRFAAYPGTERFALKNEVEAIGVADLMREVIAGGERGASAGSPA